jgi:hypothetical protein
VVIEELPAEEIRAYALSDSRNPVIPDAAYVRGYLLGKPDAGKCSLLYGVRNASKIAARNTKYYWKVVVTTDGKERTVPLAQGENKGLVLVPDQYITRTGVIPADTFYYGHGEVRIKLAVTFSGEPSDPNTYFYLTSLKIKQHADDSALPGGGLGAIVVDSQDEGIVTNLQDIIG